MSEYKFGYNENMLRLLQQRDALSDASFLLPYLKSSMTLLDCGCGPGSITAGFASILTDGSVIAIDIDDTPLVAAQKLAKEKNLKNISFQKASILNLPFLENSFDVVFTRATLYHLKENKKAIKEMYRVTKKDGIIAACEPDFGGMFYYPENSLINEAQKYRTKILTEGGADLYIGRKLRHLFGEAGCQKTIAFTTSEVKGDTRALQAVADYLANELTDTSLAQEFEKIVSKNRVTGYQKAYKEFAKDPAAFINFTWCQAIGFK